jgi:hypothetical protein
MKAAIAGPELKFFDLAVMKFISRKILGTFL